MRGLIRLASGREWPSDVISNSSTRQPRSCFARRTPLVIEETPKSKSGAQQTSDSAVKPLDKVPPVRYNFAKLLFPFTARFLLLTVEFVAIYFGTTRQHDVLAGAGFDARLFPVSDSNAQPLIDIENACSGFLGGVPAGSNAGELLRCVQNFEVYRNPRPSSLPGVDPDNTSIALLFDEGRNELVFQVSLPSDYFVSNFRVQIIINSLSGEMFRMAPLRPDVQFDESLQVFRSVVRRAVTQLDKELEGNLSLFPGGTDRSILPESEVGRTYFVYSQVLLTTDDNYSAKEVKNDTISAITAASRALPLGRNSSGVPWVHDGKSGYKQDGSAMIATLELNRIAHGALVMMVATLWLVRVVMQKWAGVGMGFEEAGLLVCQRAFEDESVRESMGDTEGDSGVSELVVRRFAWQRVGHLGFVRTDERQLLVASFEQCHTVK
ncbi:hypothetical protein FGB62_120g135 [Gracilaria domingensis]|nr:hypothetical protein FGB62_120g135 [Gracilaria domingensis]